MINIDKNSTQVEVFFPRNERNFTPSLLKIRSVVKNVDYDYLITCTIEGDYFKCTLDLSDLVNGEYKYVLTDGLDCTYGLIRIGNPKPNVTKNNTTITYKPYYGE